MHKVAVYGSLRKGLGLHGILEQQEFLGMGKTEECWKMMDLGAFPALVPEIKEPIGITVEVYDCDDLALSSMDHAEGHPDFYYRSEFPITMEDGEVINAWLYYLHKPRDWGYRNSQVECGDWMQYLMEGN